MVDWGLYLAIVAALAIGFWQGIRYAKKRHKRASHSLDQQYFQGLNFLLNEEPDAAVDSFIRALEVNSETLETHLALGKLLRKRGEVDRAIRIHRNLLARPGLNAEQSQQAQYELATDFAKAGLLDRAEGLLKELVADEGPFQIQGLQRLLEVYRDEHEWEQGLGVLQSLSGSRFSKSYEQWAPIRAHFCCELAELAMLDAKYELARQWLKQALSFDKKSPRANLLLGKLEISAGNAARGIQQLQKVVEQAPYYLSETLPWLNQGYTQTNSLDKYQRYLVGLYQVKKTPVLASALADLMASRDGYLAAAEFIAADVKQNPSGMGLHKLLDYYLSFADGKTKEHLLALQTVMQRIISQKTSYQCRHCGFKGQELHWLCPSCKRWGQIKPVRDLSEH
ncbi:MAG: lipopolysaccharide assembly protein LapB [Pseudomonadota bacterium]